MVPFLSEPEVLAPLSLNLGTERELLENMPLPSGQSTHLGNESCLKPIEEKGEMQVNEQNISNCITACFSVKLQL